MALSHDDYGERLLAAHSGELSDLSDGTTDIRCALMDGTHSFDQAHDSWADVSANEITANAEYNDDGYTSPGQSLENHTLTHDGAGVVTFDADDVIWPDSTIDADFAVLYDNEPADDVDKKLLTCVTFDGTETSENGDFIIDWDDIDGIFRTNSA